MPPENADKPVFVWIPVSGSDDAEYDPEVHDQSMAFGHLFHNKQEEERNEDHVSIDSIFLVMDDMGNGQNLDHVIDAWYRGAFTLDGSPINACLSRLTRGKTGDVWRGPIAFVGRSKDMNTVVYRDLDTADLTIALKAMVHFANKQRAKKEEMGKFRNGNHPYVFMS